MKGSTQLLLLLLYLLTLCLDGAHTAHYDDESSLRTAMLTGYEYKIRPASTVTVYAKLSLLNINVLDVPSQRLSVSGWLTLTWSDPRLTWTPSTYGNIEDLYDTELVFWRPEIIVDNSVLDLAVLESDKLLIRATSEGNMTWEPPGIFQTHCDVDVTYYPFDTQTCVVEVTSWALTLTELDLQALESEIDIADYQESGEWDMLSTWTERRELVDGSSTQAEIAFSMKLRRKPSYYITTILIPVIVTSALCVVVFLLPAESGEKVGYSLTILLTYTVMLTLVASYMPPTSKHTSVLSVYLMIILFVGVFSTLLTVIVLLFHHNPEEKKIPNWLRSMARGCMMRIAQQRRSKKSNSDKASNSNEPAKRSSPLNSQAPKVTSEDNSQETYFILENKNRAQNNGGQAAQPNVTGTSTEDRKRKQNHPEVRECWERDDQLTWQEVAALLDAVCLRIFGLCVFLLTVIVLLTLIIGGYTT